MIGVDPTAVATAVATATMAVTASATTAATATAAATAIATAIATTVSSAGAAGSSGQVDWAAVFTLISAAATAVAAGATAWSARSTSRAAGATRDSVRATMLAAQGQTMESCLERFSAIMKDRLEAEKRPPWPWGKPSVDLAKYVYQAQADLLWMEFHLWRENVIPDEVMLTWLEYCGLKRDDTIGATGVTYQGEWRRLVAAGHFAGSDNAFVRCINGAFEGAGREELKQYKTMPYHA